MPLISRVLDRQPVRSLREYIDMGGGNAARTAQHASPDEIIRLLSASGLRGRGGAGFPTGTKWKTVADARSRRHITSVVVNAAEGEPGTFKDRALLRTNPYRVLEGAIVAANVMQSDQIQIGIKGTFDREISRLTGAIAEMRSRGWLHDLDIQIVLGPSSYLFGEETALLEVIEGRQPFPRVTPPYRRGLQADDTRSAGGVSLATADGNEGPPALVDNVETLANIPLIVESGPEWFRELGTQASPGTIVCTVSGATRRSAVGEVSLGSTLREVIDLLGWGPRPGRSIQVVLAGTANALIPPSLLDTPLTYEAMRDAGSGLGSAGFIVFDDTTEPLAVAAGVARFLSVESCGQCEHCKSDGLDIAAQLRRSLQETSPPLDVAALRHRIDTVTTGARCNLAEQQGATTASLLDLFPDSLRSRHHTSTSDMQRMATIAPIQDLVGGRASLDIRQLDKQPDWSFNDHDSGATPAARLGNTPVHIARHDRTTTWPDWIPDLTTAPSAPLAEDVHEVHDAIEASIERAMEGGHEDLEDRIDEVVVAVRTHVDVTRRVLFPMARRVGNDDGDRLADAAETQEQTLLRLVDEIDRSDIRRCMQDIGVAMHEHAAIGDELLELLHAALDPLEISSLADGLAAARATSTISRLYRNASRAPAPASRSPRPSTSDADMARRPATPGAHRGSATSVDPVVSVKVDTTDRVPVEADAPAWASPSDRSAATIQDQRTTGHTMVVGVDGSPASSAALGWAGRFARRVGAEILVANIFEPEQAEISPDEFDRLLVETERRLTQEWTAPLEGTGALHRCVQLTGTPERLLAATEAADADLLVVGTRGTGRHAGLHVGSLAHHLAHHTRSPLPIVRPASAASNFDRIVVGVDGSPGSAAAVRWCADIAVASGTQVTAVCAFDPHARRAPIGDTTDSWAKAEEAISSEWVAPLRATRATVRTQIIETKHPLAALEQVAASEAATLFIVGARQLSAVGGMRLGRLPMHLVHHTQLPVILVPNHER